MTWPLYAEFTALPGSESRVSELVAELTGTVITEPGCIRFEPFVQTENPRHWLVFEEYTDGDAFRAHLASAHSVAFNAVIADHIQGGASVVTMLNAVGAR